MHVCVPSGGIHSLGLLRYFLPIKLEFDICQRDLAEVRINCTFGGGLVQDGGVRESRMAFQTVGLAAVRSPFAD